MKIAVLITTYCRPDGAMTTILPRTLDSVFTQTHKDFHLFVIGDRYDPDQELTDIVSKYPKEKIYLENLPFAAERDTGYRGEALWCSGGVAAGNYGLDVIQQYGYNYVAKLDHDDYWTENHLEEINTAIERFQADFVCTRSRHTTGEILPPLPGAELYYNYLPEPCRLIHSTICMNFQQIPLRYRDLVKIQGRAYPADADLWERTNNYMQQHELRGVCVNRITCFHDTEAISKQSII